jgi:hypothetical protein
MTTSNRCLLLSRSSSNPYGARAEAAGGTTQAAERALPADGLSQVPACAVSMVPTDQAGHSDGDSRDKPPGVNPMDLPGTSVFPSPGNHSARATIDFKIRS